MSLAPADSPEKNPISDQKSQQGYELKSYRNKPKEPVGITAQTGRLVVATWLLGAATLAAVAVGIWQGTITRSAVENARLSDSSRSVRDIARDIRDSIRAVATLDSTGEQISIAREGMEKQLRAYLSVTVADSLTNGDAVEFVIRNTGVTPALDIDYGARDHGKLSIAKAVRPNHHIGVLPPQDHTTFIDFRWSPALLLYRRFVLSGGNAVVYFVGKIIYSDVFGVRHHTNFRFRTGTPRPTDIWMLREDSVGNCMD